MEKKYKIKDREWYNDPDNWIGAPVDSWDEYARNMLGTIQEGKEDDGGGVFIHNYYFSGDEVEEIIQLDSLSTDNGIKFAVTNPTEFTDKHYNFNIPLTAKEINNEEIRLDPYRVAKGWKLGEKDNTGCLFHILKGIARFGNKNSVEREIKAMEATIKRMKELLIGEE